MTVLGSQTRFWDYGDERSATTFVMVHGFRGDHHGLEPIVAQLTGVRVVSPDLPGFGASGVLNGARHDIAGYSRWLTAFIAELQPRGRFVLLGHSFGSIVVAAALAGGASATSPGETGDTAWRRPDDVILVNPIGAPALTGPRAVGTRLAIFYYWLGAALPERAGFALLRNPAIVRGMSEAMAKTRDRDLRRWIHRQHAQYFSAFADRDTVLEAFRASVGHDVSEYAARIPERTLLVAAERDDITPVSAQERLATLFPHARLEVIPAVGHLIHYEVPVRAAELITGFLSEDAT
jgi:pimeloyl-ACP methyl ester carboxylesterase